ncbi:MAG: hypothetical protein GX829_09765 [Clostridium sp.]|nr:hypothetical protein [Clostridium sp.]
MNKFNEIRNSIYNPSAVTKYPMFFIEKYVEETKNLSRDKKEYGEKFSQISTMDSK